MAMQLTEAIELCEQIDTDLNSLGEYVAIGSFVPSIIIERLMAITEQVGRLADFVESLNE